MAGEDMRNAGILPPSLSAGAVIAGYLLQEQVGAGGMAVVFRAVDQRLGRLVALKVLAPALTSDGAFRRRFVRESKAAAAVDDPHIIPVHDAGEANGVLFIAMRYVPGTDVRSLLHRECPLSPGRVAAIISPVASALDAAHAAGLVHRDVKPANMLLDVRPDRPDHVYLSDFGLSKAAISSVGLTGAGQFLGTPNYTAPEQIKGEPVDGRADQYALACAAFEMLAGEAPFQRDEVTAVIWAHLSVPPPPLTARRPDLAAAAITYLPGHCQRHQLTGTTGARTSPTSSARHWVWTPITLARACSRQPGSYLIIRAPRLPTPPTPLLPGMPSRSSARHHASRRNLLHETPV